jgi:hypothetical protein
MKIFISDPQEASAGYAGACSLTWLAGLEPEQDSRKVVTSAVRNCSKRRAKFGH